MTARLDMIQGAVMITSDAYEIGEITDVRYDPFEWRVVGLRVKPTKKASVKLAAGFGKSAILILPRTFVLNDVLLLSQPIERLKDLTVPDNNNISSLSTLVNKKVVSRDSQQVGITTTVMVDPDAWKVSSIVVQLDKAATEAMGMKKGLFSKISVGISAEMILPCADMIHLNAPIAELTGRVTILE